MSHFLVLLACAAVSDEDELEGGHVGGGVGGGGRGGGGHRALGVALLPLVILVKNGNVLGLLLVLRKVTKGAAEWRQKRELGEKRGSKIN